MRRGFSSFISTPPTDSLGCRFPPSPSARLLSHPSFRVFTAQRELRSFVQRSPIRYMVADLADRARLG